jgi:hypothetical protein
LQQIFFCCFLRSEIFMPTGEQSGGNNFVAISMKNFLFFAFHYSTYWYLSLFKRCCGPQTIFVRIRIWFFQKIGSRRMSFVLKYDPKGLLIEQNKRVKLKFYFIYDNYLHPKNLDHLRRYEYGASSPKKNPDSNPT